MYNFEPLLIGAFSGAISTSVLQPLDVIKTRIQLIDKVSDTKLNSRHFPGIKLVIRDVVHTDGIVGLWKGLCPSLLRSVPGLGIYFASLNSITQAICPDGKSASPMQSMAVGMGARTIAGTAVMPFSMLKTRYESGMFSYSSVGSALNSIYKHEGLKGTFRGLVATLSRDVPYSGLYVMFYNSTKKILAEEFNVVPSTLYFSSSAAFAGFMASLLTHPPDVIKTHIQTNPQNCTSYYNACKVIIKNYGYAGFVRGLGPRLFKKTLVSTISWTTFEKLMHFLRGNTN